MKCRTIFFLIFIANSVWTQNQLFVGLELGASRLKSSIQTLESFLGDTRLGTINIYSDPRLFYDVKFGNILSLSHKSSLLFAIGLKSAGYHFDDITKETNLVSYSRSEVEFETSMRYSIYEFKRNCSIQLALGLEYNFLIKEKLDSSSILSNSEFSKSNFRFVSALIYKQKRIDLFYKYRHSILDEYSEIDTQDVGNYYFVFQSIGFIYKIQEHG